MHPSLRLLSTAALTAMAVFLPLSALRAADAPAIRATAPIPAATPQRIKVPSAVMQREIPVSVTLPKGYAQSAAAYPVLYLLHGDGDNGDFFLAVNRQLHQKLTANGIAHDYTERPGAHNWDYWKLALPRQMAILDRHFKNSLAPAPKPGDADFPTPAPCARHQQKVAAIKSGKYDLVMIGDSITQTVGDEGGEWEPLKAVWAKHYAPRHALNLGYSGYRTEQILWNLQNGELDFPQSPKVITLLIGTNNTDDQHYQSIHSAEQVYAGTKAIVDLIRQRHPTTKILVLRIFPCGGPGAQTPYHRKYNRSAKGVDAYRRAGGLTAQLADGQQVFWLDIGQVFLRPDGSINTDLMPDLIHPNAAGAEAWAQAIEPTLSKLMGKAPATGARFIRDLRQGKKITLVTMGTSLTGGAWKWPDVMMNDWLNKEFPGKVTLFNEGVGASASSFGPGNNPALSGLGKLPAVLAHKPDVVFIEFTTNDAYLPYKIPQEQSKKNLNTIIDTILTANPQTEIILQTMNAVMDNPGAGPGNLHAATRPQLAAYAQGYREVAKARGLLLVDHYPNWEKLMQENPARFDQLVPDRIHPQLAGYREILLPELRKSLEN